MNVKMYEHLYRKNGFFWNQILESAVKEHAGREISYQHHKTGRPKVACFFPDDLFVVGREYGQYQTIVEYLNEEVAPIGNCDGGYIELFLTQRGKLVGFADYLMLRWGGPELDWRSSLQLLADGVAPSEIGVIE